MLGVLYKHRSSYSNIFAFFFFTNYCPNPIFCIIRFLLIQEIFRDKRKAHRGLWMTTFSYAQASLGFPSLIS